MIEPIPLLVYMVMLVMCSSEENTTETPKFAPGNPAFDYWQEPNFPLTLNFYFFNWTNPEDIYNPDVKPEFEEVGPYVYQMYAEKVNVTFNKENQTVTYQNLVHYYFDEENSPRKDYETVTTINSVAVEMAHRSRDLSYLIKIAMELVLKQTASEVHVTKTVRELLFEGYEDPILDVVKTVRIAEGAVDERFGWFYGKNGTVGVDGMFNIAVGRDGNFGALKSWNYESKTPYYEGHCADIKGTNGELFPENIKPDHIEFFLPEICRSVEFKFEKDVDVGGLSAYRFTVGAELVDNGTLVKENKCFCNGECLPSGLFNVSACREGNPIFASLPHFYLADPMYNSKVEGLNPDKDKHESYITIDPKTGAVVDFKAKGQINMLLRPIERFQMYEEVPEIVFPVFWYEKTIGAPKPQLDEN